MDIKDIKNIEKMNNSKNVTKIIFENGEELYAKDLSFVFMKVDDNNECDIHFNVQKNYEEVSRVLSNYLFAISNAFKFMVQLGVNFETACKLHFSLIQNAKKQGIQKN